jgi:hypothetical protein
MGYKGAPGAIATVEGCTVKVTANNSINILKIMGFRNRELASRAGKLSSRKGIPNKASSQVREAFKQLVERNLPQMQTDLDSLEPRDRLKFMLDLSKLILPQLQSISIDDLREREMQGFNILTINIKDNSDESNDSNDSDDSDGSDDSNSRI